MIKLSVGEFKWKTTEQVYPFEKDSAGRTLYCKEIDCGSMPNNGLKSVAHNIVGLDMTKVFKYFTYSNAGASGQGEMFSCGNPNYPWCMDVNLYPTTIAFDTDGNYNYMINTKTRIIYAK